MGIERNARPVQLFISVIAAGADVLARTRQRLIRRFGPLSCEGPIWPFDHTDFYAAEMGADLQNQFLVFANWIRAEAIADIKRETNAIEREVAQERAALGVARPVNIDPGYVDASRLVLATTKDRPHRICLAGGIFAEVTLHWESGGWKSSPWTYASFRTPHALAFLTDLRATVLAAQNRWAEFSADGPSATDQNPAKLQHRVEPPGGSIEPYSIGDIVEDVDP